MERGSVTHLYLTSDGGLDIQDLYSMVPKLDSHVQIVDHVALAKLALQAHGAHKPSADVEVETVFI